MRKSFKIGYIRAYKLRQELIEAGVLREWTNKDHKDLPKGKKPRGNIIWKNLSKYEVPKKISDI